jgi:hypothetical protein
VNSRGAAEVKAGTVATLHARTAALAIRLLSVASFREKLCQLIVKMRKEKAPATGRFLLSAIFRDRGKF